MPKNLDNIIEQIDELPTLQQVAVRLLQIIDNPKSTVQDVNRVVTQDPALASKILKLVNSAYIGLQNKVSNLQQAIVMLGFNMIKGMALSVSVFDVFTETLEGDEKFRRDFWMHSITTATVCRQVASDVGGVDPEVAFVLGLLHDIGKMVLDIHAHEEWRAIMKAVREEKTTFFTAERKVLETDHAEIGGWLAKNWQLNEDLVNGIRGHHRESMWKTSKLGCVLHFANTVSRIIQEGEVKDAVTNVQLKKSTVALGIKTKDVTGHAQFAKEELKRSAAFLETLQE